MKKDKYANWSLMCKICKNVFFVRKYRVKTAKFCSYACNAKAHIAGKNKGKRGLSGSKHGMWKGGVFTSEEGYKYVYQPHHPNATQKGYIREHRLVMEKFLGRYLDIDEVVHHCNKNVLDNRIENLVLFKSNSEHMKHEWKLKKKGGGK